MNFCDFAKENLWFLSCFYHWLFCQPLLYYYIIIIIQFIITICGAFSFSQATNRHLLGGVVEKFLYLWRIVPFFLCLLYLLLLSMNSNKQFPLRCLPSPSYFGWLLFLTIIFAVIHFFLKLFLNYFMLLPTLLQFNCYQKQWINCIYFFDTSYMAVSCTCLSIYSVKVLKFAKSKERKMDMFFSCFTAPTFALFQHLW